MMPPKEEKLEKSVQKTNYDEGMHVANTEYALNSKQDVDSEAPKNSKSSSSSEKVLQGFEAQLSPSSSVSQNIGSDSTFEPTIDMMVNDFDDEHTLNEEEALAALESQDPQEEIDTLKEESEIPLEKLLAKYQVRILGNLPSNNISALVSDSVTDHEPGPSFSSCLPLPSMSASSSTISENSGCSEEETARKKRKTADDNMLQRMDRLINIEKQYFETKEKNDKKLIEIMRESNEALKRIAAVLGRGYPHERNPTDIESSD